MGSFLCLCVSGGGFIFCLDLWVYLFVAAPYGHFATGDVPFGHFYTGVAPETLFST